MVQESKAFLDFTLEDPSTGAWQTRTAQLPDRSLAYQLDFSELTPGTRYTFRYLLRPASAPDQIIDGRSDGTFRTYAERPDTFKFSVMSNAETRSEAESLLLDSAAADGLVSNNPDVLVHLGDMH